MYRLPAAVAFLVASVTLAQEKKWEPPPTPDGWRAVAGKDGTYRFAVPKDTKRSGNRERTFTTGGLKVRTQLDYAILKDGTELAVQMSALSGTALKGVKVKDVTDLFIAAEKDDGFTVSDPKDVTLGELKAKEYRMTKGATVRRVVLFSARPKVFLLDITAQDAAKLTTPEADTFFKSFVIVPADAVQAAAKEKAEKNTQAGKDNLEKFGAKWTMSLKEMTPPEAPAAGLVRGKEFRPDSVTLKPGGNLSFRQGKAFFADAEVVLTLFLKPGESVENRTYEVAPAAVAKAGSPHLRLSTMPAGAKVPQTEPFVNKYALKLTFGAKDKDGAVPGTIYLCTPDANRSFLAGTFSLKEK